MPRRDPTAESLRELFRREGASEETQQVCLHLICALIDRGCDDPSEREKEVTP